MRIVTIKAKVKITTEPVTLFLPDDYDDDLLYTKLDEMLIDDGFACEELEAYDIIEIAEREAEESDA